MEARLSFTSGCDWTNGKSVAGATQFKALAWSNPWIRAVIQDIEATASRLEKLTTRGDEGESADGVALPVDSCEESAKLRPPALPDQALMPRRASTRAGESRELAPEDEAAVRTEFTVGALPVARYPTLQTSLSLFCVQRWRRQLGIGAG